MKHTLTAAAFVAILASPAFAQVNNTSPTPPSALSGQARLESGGFIESQHATDWRGSKLIGAVVYGPDNASIGSVSDVLIGNDSQVRAVVIGVGGFLGVGEKNVAVPLNALNITRRPNSDTIDKIGVSFTKEDLKNAPKFAFDEGTVSQTTGSSVVDKMKSLNPIGGSKN